MNELNSGWNAGVILISFGFGIACGFALAWFSLSLGRKNRELKEKLDSLQSEQQTYRQQVSQHFMKSADLIQTMTDSYRAVYEHLATGSEQLCKEPVDTPKLDIPQPTGILGTEKESKTENNPDSDTDTDPIEAGKSIYDEYLGDVPRVPDINSEESPKYP